MAGLFSMLGFAARALEAQRFGLDVTGQNIANVNTPGYTRRRALLSEVPPPDRFTAGGGVSIDGIAADRDRFLERRLLAELTAYGRESGMADSLGAVELVLGEAGESLDGRLASFFDSFARLADAPTSATARQEVVLQGRTLTAAFNEMSDGFRGVSQAADTRVRATVDEINALAIRIAGLNGMLSTVAPASGQALQLQDQVQLAVEQLARLAMVEVVDRPNGDVDLALSNGKPLVVGANFYQLSVTPRAGSGVSDIVAADGTVITAQVAGGELAGLVHVRDTLIPSYQLSLDELAHEVVARVNAIHQSGYDAAGTAGLPFFSPLAGVPGAAAAMAVNPALLASGGDALVAASRDATAVGDNAAARAIAALREARVLAGNTATFTDAWSRLVYRVGRDTRAASDEGSNRAEVVRQVALLRDSVSGVSMDEEAANLMRFQRAYEANARYFQVVDQSLETLLQLVGA